MTQAPDKRLFSTFLASIYADNGGKPLPIDISDYLNNCIFPSVTPSWIDPEGSQTQAIYTKMGLKVATGYSRLFYSDYGIYLEIDPEQIVKGVLAQSSGSTQESTSNVSSYLMYKTLDGEMTVRRQLRQAGIKSFPTGKYFIDVFSASTGDLIPIEKDDLLNMENAIVCQAVSCRGKYHDEISPEVSRRWPFVREDYELLCSKEDPLGLLGVYQVILTTDTGGIANLFCNMATNKNFRYAGKNLSAMVNALYGLCCDAPPGQKIAIPYMIGCENSEDWDDVHRKISCRLEGFNVHIVRQKEPERDPTPVSSHAPDLQDDSGRKLFARNEKPTDRPTDAVKEFHQNSTAPPVLISQNELSERDELFSDILASINEMPTDKLRALLVLLKPNN